MGKKKDCFGSETYVCMTPNCPYAKECIQVVWEKRLERIIAKQNTRARKPRKSPARVAARR